MRRYRNWRPPAAIVPRPMSDAGEMMPAEPRHDETAIHSVHETSAVAARQGVISGRVILVLLTSLFLAVVALGVSFCTLR